MTKILIAGHKGYIGSYLHKALRGDGIDLKTGTDINSVNWNSKSIRAPQDIVINCAAELSLTPRMVYSNVLGLESVINHCHTWNAKLIHFSTVSIYGDSYYGLTKRMGEDIIRHWSPKDWCILRMTNVYSNQKEHQGGDSPANRFQRGDVEIFGTGMHQKDHIHIKDVLQAVQMAIKDNWTGEVNLSSGTTLSMNNIFAKLGKGEPIHVDRKPAMEKSTLDNSRALSLGWKPTWDLKND